MSYTLKISLKGTSKPIVWRRIKVNNNTSFETLHYIIQSVFGWDNYHLYEFYLKKEKEIYVKPQKDIERRDEFSLDGIESVYFGGNEEEFLSSETTYLSDLLKSMKDNITYTYDFGDFWEHKILVEEINDEVILYPICLKGKGKTPPEDCGGVWGYYDMLEILEKKKPKSEYRESKEWLEGMGYELPWKPEEFDLESINQELIHNIQDNFKHFRWEE